MNQALVKQRNDIALQQVFDSMAAALVDSFGSIVVQPVDLVVSGDFTCVDTEEWLEAIPSKRIVIRGSLHGSQDGHHVHVVFDLVDAITLSGQMMLTSDDVIEAHRESMTFEQEHHEAFVEIGNIVCSAINTVLKRETGAFTGARVRDFAMIHPGLDPSGILSGGAALTRDFKLRIGNYPETGLTIMVDHEVAQSWNGDTPLLVFGEDGVATAEPKLRTDRAAAGSLRATLSAFVTTPDVAAVIKSCGDALDLKIQRHARTDIPNPAAHRDEIVVIEIPVGEEKRFDWARRLKQYHPNLPVVLLIHEPSRPRVVHGLLTRDNAILAWPSTEAQLLAKIKPLIAIHSAKDDS